MKVILNQDTMSGDLLPISGGNTHTDLGQLWGREIFDAVIEPYAHVKKLIWCQEEPQNQGAWDQIKHRFHTQLENGKELYYVGRAAAAAPAVGFHPVHVEQQETLIDEALSGRINPSMNRRTPV